MPPRFGGPPAPKCPTCGQSVYHAEQVMGPGGKIYHRPCLKCAECGKTLDPGSVVDHDYDAYCRPCHSKQFGPRGYGVGHSGLVGEYRPASSPNVSPQRPARTTALSSTTSASSLTPASGPNFPVNNERAVPAVPSRAPIFAPTQNSVLPRAMSPPAPPPRPMGVTPLPKDESVTQTANMSSLGRATQAPPAGSATSLARQPEHTVGPNNDDEDVFSAPSVPRAARPALPVPPPKPTSFPSPNYSASVGHGSVASIVGATVGAGRDLCPRCRSVVYAAEAVSALGCKWHKRCLRCCSCSTTLNGTNMVEKSGEPHCRRCHTSATLQDQRMITRPGLF